MLLTPRSAAGESFEEIGAGSFKAAMGGGAGGGPGHDGGGGKVVDISKVVAGVAGLAFDWHPRIHHAEVRRI